MIDFHRKKIRAGIAGLLMMMGKGFKKAFFIGGKTYFQVSGAITGWITLLISSIGAFFVSISSSLTNRVIKKWIISQS